MRTRRTMAIVVVLVVMVMAFATVAQATPRKVLPIRVMTEAVFVPEQSIIPAPEGRCSGPALLLHYSGEGTMGGLGEVTFESDHCSYLEDDWETLAGRYGEAEMVITVLENGDRIHASYEGRQLNDTRYLEFLRITGGTGVYTGATGAAYEIVTVDLTTFTASIRGGGWISY